MPAAGTRETFIARYHTLMRRDAWRNARGRDLILRSLDRTFGPWLPADRDAAILDVGCGEGALLTFLAARGYRNLAGFDLSPENVALCHDARLDFVAHHDARDVASFAPGSSWDLIFAVDLVEHLRKDDAVPFLAALRRRLAPGGTLIVRTPNMGSLLGGLERYGDLTHEWGLTERSARDLAAAAGFARDAIEVTPAWDAATLPGRGREAYLRILHRLVYLSAGRARPRIASANLLLRAVAR